MWRETLWHIQNVTESIFQSTPSVWRETDDWVEHFKTYYPFQSTPSVWRETYTSFIVVVSLTFQSTPSVWRETIDGYKNVDRLKHFNPLPPCGGRLPFEIVSCRHIDFNPLPPCGGRLLDIWVKIRVGLHFNPLPPCGGRQIRMINYDVATHFNPLPPCGGRPECLIKASRNVVFQSTPSVWRETRRRLAAQVFMRNFNPLHPCGGRPCSYYYSIKIRNISIHSIRVEGDRLCKCPIHPQKHFNPLPPCGGRPRYDIIILVTVSFQSTPSVWRETDRYRLCRAWQMISIHSLRVEGDMMYIHPVEYQGISIHSLRVEGDGCFFHILCSRQ